MQRIALVVGLIGAIISGYFSIYPLKTIIQHNKFEALKTSPFVTQKQQKLLFNLERIHSQYIVAKAKLESEMPPMAEDGHIPIARVNLSTEVFFLTESTLDEIEKVRRTHSYINQGGISSVVWADMYDLDELSQKTPWTRNPAPESITTIDSSTYYPIPAPSFWEYLLIAAFPILGFLIPWSVVRAIEWVTVGFTRREAH